MNVILRHLKVWCKHTHRNDNISGKWQCPEQQMTIVHLLSKMDLLKLLKDKKSSIK